MLSVIVGSFRRHQTQHNDIQRNDTQHNDTQHNDTHHNDTANVFVQGSKRLLTIAKALAYNYMEYTTQHNDTYHYDTQHNNN
jgi:hypothetical protein